MKFKLTAQGIVYLCFSLLMLFLGFFRGEIFTGSAGIILLCYFLFTAPAVFITALLWKNEKPAVSIKDNTFDILPNNLKHTRKVFPKIALGTTVQYVFEFNELNSGNAVLAPSDLFCSIELNRKSARAVYQPKARGEYFCKKQFLRIFDLGHFYEIILPQKSSKAMSSYFVFPKYDLNAKLEPPIFYDDYSKQKNNLIRNNEFYDIRQYFPGDDIRKINWKVFAHTSELAVRQGELLPPPARRFSIFVDSPILELSHFSQFDVEQYNIYINKIASIAVRLYKQGYEFNLAVLDNNNKIKNEHISFEDENAKMLILKLLSTPQIKFLKSKDLSGVKKYEIDGTELFNTLAPESGILYFMYANSLGNNSFYKKFQNFKNKLAVVIGPNILPSAKSKFWQKVLFENTQMLKAKKHNNAMYKLLNTELQKLEGEHYNAKKI